MTKQPLSVTEMFSSIMELLEQAGYAKHTLWGNMYGSLKSVVSFYKEKGLNDYDQVTQMIAAEAVTYALAGCVIGYVVGAAIGKLLFSILIQEHFVYAVWTPPVFRLLIVVVFAVAAMLAAIYTPSKRMRNMAVTETINEL